jgi:hypothetical protein
MFDIKNMKNQALVASILVFIIVTTPLDFLNLKK